MDHLDDLEQLAEFIWQNSHRINKLEIMATLRAAYELGSKKKLAIKPLTNKESFRHLSTQGQRDLLISVLQRHNWNRRKACKDLGYSYKGLLVLIERFGLKGGEQVEEEV